MNMNNPLENLRQLTEAVRMAGADIAPTYIEYVQLAFVMPIKKIYIWEPYSIWPDNAE